MKKMKTLAASMAAAALFAGCTSELETNGGGTSVPEGIPTYASFSIAVDNSGSPTRSASQTGEKEIEKVKILIFDKAGVLETLTEELTPTSEGNGYKVTAIKTTTGEKTIYAIANNGTFVNGLSLGMTLADFEAKTYEAVKKDNGSKAITVPIATKGKFLMFGSKKETLTKQAGKAAQNVAITVTRAAAKSQLLFKNVKQSQEFKPEVKVTFGEAKSQLSQLQPTMFVAANDKTSTGTVTTWEDAYTTTEANWIAARVKGFDQANDSESAEVTAYSHYTAENLPLAPKMNNITCMMIRVKATPTTWSSNEGTAETDGSFYVLAKFKSSAEKKYKNLESYYGVYKTQAEAQKVLDSGALKNDPNKANYGVIKFTNGLCYYRLNLRDVSKLTASEKYSVLRNNFYKVTVTEINNFGWNDPNDMVLPDDTTPAEEETSIDATITVEDWHDVNMDEPLG